MAKKGLLGIEGNVFAEYAEKLDKLGADLKKVFTDALEQAAETIQDDTREAIADGNLPAKGKYSKGNTEESILANPRVSWSGSVGEIPVGFDKTKPGAGGFLITGTPKMKPDYALQKIYKQQRYANKIKKDMNQVFQDEVERIMGRS